MTHIRRRIFFYVLLAIFLLFGSGVVFYAQGWRFDRKTLSPVKVGAIYIRTFPENAAILLDGKALPLPSGFFERGTFVNGLFPRTYRLKASSPGYHEWEGNIPVLPSLISQLRQLVLVPKDPSPVLSGPVRGFTIVDDLFLLETPDGKIVSRGIELPGSRIVGVAEHGTKTVTFNATTKAYHSSDLLSGTSTNLNALFLKSGVTLSLYPPSSVIVMQEDGSLLLVKGLRNLFALDTRTRTAMKLDEGTSTIATAAASLEWIGWSTFDANEGLSRFSFYNRIGRTFFRSTATVPGKTAMIAFNARNELGALQEDGSLYIFRPREAPEKIASDVRSFVFSAAGNGIATIENSSLEVFSLDAPSEYFRFNVPDPRAIRSVEWYKDDRHLFLHYPDRVSFLDFADANLENLVSVAETPLGTYRAETNVFYFLKGGAVYKLQFPE